MTQTDPTPHGGAASTDPALLLQAVGDATRLRLLRLLAREELSVQELVGILGISQPRVSKHLGVLRDAGWIRQRRDRTWSWHRVATAEEFPGGAALRAGVLAAAERAPAAPEDDTGLAQALRARDERAHRFFAGAAARWDEIRRAFERPEVHAAALSALVPAGLRVVDIGTGTGALLPVLAAAGCRVVAVDNSEPMLARARELCAAHGWTEVAFGRADLQTVPLRDGCCDAAFCSMVLHHVARPGQAIAEMGRVVRPGGRVVVIDFARHDLAWMREELAHQWLGFTRQELETWSAEAGLQARAFQAYAGGRAPGGVGRRAGGRGAGAWPDLILFVAEKAS